MEYMASGTPVLTTNLPGMPEEYKQYVYLIEDESAEGIARAIKTTFDTVRSERDRKGHSAQEFVLNEKNNLFQSKRVLSMLEAK